MTGVISCEGEPLEWEEILLQLDLAELDLALVDCISAKLLNI